MQKIILSLFLGIFIHTNTQAQIKNTKKEQNKKMEKMQPMMTPEQEKNLEMIRNEAIRKKNVTIISDGVWQVNQEKTFEQFVEKIKKENPEKLTQVLAQKEEYMGKIRQYVFFFRERELTYRLSSKEYAEEGIFELLNSSALRLVLTNDKDKSKREVGIIELTTKILIVDLGEAQNYVFEKLTKL